MKKKSVFRRNMKEKKFWKSEKVLLQDLDMFGNFFRNLGSGNVSGLSIAGLVAGGP